MPKTNMSDPLELFYKIEALYSTASYEDIMKYEAAYLQIDHNCLDSEQLHSLTEMFAYAYMRQSRQEKKPGLSSQYKIGLRYTEWGIGDSEILNWKLNTEEALFMKYVKVNKYILYVILLAVLLVNLDLVQLKGNYLPVLTSVAVVWYVMNYVMNCRVKHLYLKLLRFIYK